MADLLECVIQIMALREALATATGAPSACTVMSAEVQGPPVWQRMAEAERRYGIVLGAGRAAPPDAGPATGVEAFVAMRRANLAMLDRCRAPELAGFVEWPGRPSTTVADLVAIMLANDTEELGELRRDGARSLPWRETVEESEVEGSLREPGRVASKGAGPG